jgi:hypothetical protein
MIAIWEVFFRLGSSQRGDKEHDLGPIDAAVAGLLALILAFSFSMAAERFDEREEVIVREANALDTTHWRCDFLASTEQAACRELLSRYAEVRVAFYEAAHNLEKLRDVVARSERLHGQLWELVRRSQAVRDTPALALTIASLNELIDLHTDRLAAQRRIVPQEVTAVTLSMCLAWGAFAGYLCGLAGKRVRASWIGFAVLVSVVIFVSIDLDRPGRGFIRPVRGHAVMVDLAAQLRAQGATRDNQRSLPP